MGLFGAIEGGGAGPDGNRTNDQHTTEVRSVIGECHVAQRPCLILSPSVTSCMRWVTEDGTRCPGDSQLLEGLMVTVLKHERLGCSAKLPGDRVGPRTVQVLAAQKQLRCSRYVKQRGKGWSVYL